jgi:hypothetical protein
VRLRWTQFAVAFFAMALLTVACPCYTMAQGDTFGTQTDPSQPPNGGDSGNGGTGTSIPGFGDQPTEEAEPKAPLPVALQLRALIDEAADRGGFNSGDLQRAHQLDGELRLAPRFFPPSHPSPIECLDLMVAATGDVEREAFAVQQGHSATSDEPKEEAHRAHSEARRGVCCYAANANGQNETLAGDNCAVIAQALPDEGQQGHGFKDVPPVPLKGGVTTKVGPDDPSLSAGITLDPEWKPGPNWEPWHRGLYQRMRNAARLPCNAPSGIARRVITVRMRQDSENPLHRRDNVIVYPSSDNCENALADAIGSYTVAFPEDHCKLIEMHVEIGYITKSDRYNARWTPECYR